MLVDRFRISETTPTDLDIYRSAAGRGDCYHLPGGVARSRGSYHPRQLQAVLSGGGRARHFVHAPDRRVIARADGGVDAL